MQLIANENTVQRLYKLCNRKETKKIKFKINTAINELLKEYNNESFEIKIDRSLMNNEIEFINNNGSVILKTNYEIFESSIQGDD